jgi:hypothetical protein
MEGQHRGECGGSAVQIRCGHRSSPLRWASGWGRAITRLDVAAILGSVPRRGDSVLSRGNASGVAVKNNN